MSNLWFFLSDPSVQRTLSWLGSGLAAVAVALWTFYRSRRSDAGGKLATRSARARQGIAAAGDIHFHGTMRITNGIPVWVIALAALALLLIALRGLGAAAYLGREATATTVSNAWLAVGAEPTKTYVHFGQDGVVAIHDAETRSVETGTWSIDEAGRVCIVTADVEAFAEVSGCYRLSKGLDRFLAVDGQGRVLRLEPLNVAEHRIPLEPRATFLRTANDPGAVAASPIDLAALGLSPGDVITISSYGQFNCCKDGANDGSLHRTLIGVFSANSELLSSGIRHRVPGAIAGGRPINTGASYFGKAATDIPEDFIISSYGGEQREALVTIPAGASTLFLSPHDSHFQDNRTVGEWGAVIRHLTTPVSS